jgi:hypothetical protein
MKRIWNPVLVLYLLAPICGELLSGSQPPLEFFRPLNLVFITAFYGSGALLVREITRRWQKGWPTLLILGAAYGIVEEGLAAKSFFDPSWMDLGPLGVYGRWLGVNWVWAALLTAFHAVFSLSIPILLTELVFPKRRNVPWLSRRGLSFFAFLFVGMAVFLYLFITPYRVPIPHALLTLAVLAALIGWAWRNPVVPAIPAAKHVGPPLRFALFGFGATLALFALGGILPNTRVPPALTFVAMLGLGAGVYRAISRAARAEAWTERHALALAIGGLSFFLLLQPLLELDRSAAEDRSGCTLVALVGAGLLWALSHSLRRRGETAASSLGVASSS